MSKKKVFSCVLIIITALIFWGSLGFGTTSSINGRVVHEVGCPAYVIFDSRTFPKLIVKNICYVSFLLGTMLFLSGYLYSESKHEKKKGSISAVYGNKSEDQISTKKGSGRNGT
jgi:hypothetical protein